jgi:N-acetylmuramoyl-L-alanine amidase
MSRRVLFHLLLLVPALLLLVASTSVAKVRVQISGALVQIDSFDDNGVTYISLSQLAGELDGTLQWERLGQEVGLTIGSAQFRFLIDAPFFRLNESSYNMTYAAQFRDGQLFVAALTFTPFLDRALAQKLTWNNDDQTLRIDSEYFNVNDISIQQKANGLLIELFLSEPMPYDIFVTPGNWVNISIRDASLNIARLESRRDDKYLIDLKAYQETGVGQVSLQMRQAIKGWHHKLVNDPPRIQISIPDASFSADSVASPAPKLGPDNKIDVIVIDPGHGGQDYGAIGGKGTREKDATLAIARQLADQIRKDKQFQVVMTRNSDKTLTLQERADIANKAGGDLFVSIHANASPQKTARGWNVFFLAPAKNDSARSVEQLENSYFLRDAAGGDKAGPSADNPVVSILNEMIMTEFQTESSDLALMIDKEFRKRLETPARGVDQAGFFVLNKVFTPSVLIETAFISNAGEERLLKQADFHKQVATAIYAAVKRFKAKYESK